MNTDRIYGIDILRTLCFIAIIIFHSSWIIWLNPSGPPNPLPTSIWRFAEFYARALDFSGFSILFFTSFLIGYKENAYKKLYWLPFFLIGSWILFSFCTFLKEKEFSLEWDIHPLIAVGMVTGQWILRRKKNLVFALISIAMLLCPFWKFSFFSVFPLPIKEILVGVCPQDYADWPLLPWVGLLWLGMLSGSFVKKNEPHFFYFHKFEPFFFTLICFYFWNFKDVYFQTKLGDGWSCYNFRQEPYVFWAHFLLWLALLRLCFYKNVQLFFARISFIRFLSTLEINRNFFLAYMLHYLVMFTLVGLARPWEEGSPLWKIDVVLLAILPITELSCRLVLRKMSVFRKDANVQV